ncbi:MAG: hypothetical protein IK152_08810 [Lachnospiraceae bacterium]|nr:hypothetical protein [Lachnospiraceae bacterium]
MRTIDNNTAFRLLLASAASGGRGELLFGDSLERVKKIIPDFLGKGDFPDIYLEFPLFGEPFLDIFLTVVAEEPYEGSYITSPLAEDSEKIVSFIRDAHRKYREVSGGFEIDTRSSNPGQAGVLFEPRSHTELAGGFCQAIGEPLYGKLYEEMAGRLAASWQPSYFGLFRGREGLPLRIGGYLGQEEIAPCTEDPERIERAFKAAHFTAYDDEMIGQIRDIMAISPTDVEFQFDIFPDGTTGDVFSLSTFFAIEQPRAVITSFKEGPGREYMNLLRKWNVADDRWEKSLDVVYAGSLPLGDVNLTFSIFPQWIKVRWKKKKLVPAKIYLLMKAGEFSKE